MKNSYPYFSTYFKQALRPFSSTGQECLTHETFQSDDYQITVNATPVPVALTEPNNAQPHLTVAYLKPFPEINQRMRLMKRAFDIIFSIVIMVTGLPVFTLLYLLTKFSSEGPAFYRQERLGRHGRSFYIYKFRSMRTDAEKFGPRLSSEQDPRVTRWGRLIRRTRLDELPQFWNVLKGEMSVVGPRPERQYFVEKIIEKKPGYGALQQLKPGITSMGQVCFGYAENVDQMCTRMEYDLDYLKQANFKTDLKVIMKTVRVMVQCKGK